MTHRFYLADIRSAISEAITGWVVLLVGALAFAAVATPLALQSGHENLAILLAALLVGPASLWMFLRLLSRSPLLKTGSPQDVIVSTVALDEASQSDLVALTTATVELLNARDRSSDVAIFHGNFLVCRMTVVGITGAGKSALVASLLTDRQADYLSRHPRLLEEPARLLDLLPTVADGENE